MWEVEHTYLIHDPTKFISLILTQSFHVPLNAESMKFWLTDSKDPREGFKVRFIINRMGKATK